MKKFNLFQISLLIVFFGCTPSNPMPGSGIVPNTAPIIIDYNDVNAGLIPDDIIARIKGLDIYFEHASVGANIVGGPSDYVSGASVGFGGLDFLAASNSRYAINHEHGTDGDVGLVSVTWIDENNGLYDNHRGNPLWTVKVQGFYNRMVSGDFAEHVDIAMFKFCWIDDQDTAQEAFDEAQTTMESLQASYSNTLFVWWTMPITTQGAYSEALNDRRDAYNSLVRNYCVQNNQILFDLADIESHNNSGTQLTDTNGNFYLDSGYSSDVGHLNQAGATKVANAFWVLLARCTGWNP